MSAATDPSPEQRAQAAEHTVPADVDTPVGTRVLAWPGVREGHPLVTATRSKPWAIYPGRPVVAVEGFPGGIALTHVDVLPPPRAELEPQALTDDADRGAHYPTTPVQCACGWRETDPGAGTWTTHLTGRLAAANDTAAQALRDAADYVQPGQHQCFRPAGCYQCGQRDARDSILTDLLTRADRLDPGTRTAHHDQRDGCGDPACDDEHGDWRPGSDR